MKCGALDENLPTADLFLTASHAIFKDGFLVPVSDLVNDASIAFEEAEGHDILEFFHIELAKHERDLRQRRTVRIAPPFGG